MMKMKLGLAIGTLSAAPLTKRRSPLQQMMRIYQRKIKQQQIRKKVKKKRCHSLLLMSNKRKHKVKLKCQPSLCMYRTESKSGIEKMRRPMIS